MAFEERARIKPKSSGPFIAEITNHLDPLKMGRLEVSVKDGIQNSLTNPGETYIAQYLSPFHGATSVRHEGTNAKDFNDVQKSYGFWMIPPDIGSRVIIMFVNQDPNQCFWIGSVQDTYQNFMVPGLASTSTSNMTSAQQQKYGTKNVPVAEYNKLTELLKDPNVDKKPKPVHPFADRLLEQGLLLDNIRGLTSSSARRETPSGVFGISTPGPLDPKGPKKPIGYTKSSIAPVSRLGGTTFVMDDGDANGQNELVRIRTRTGHQILLHNTNDLIYIANAKGTAWIELTSAGKIDVYAEDSVSIHTKGDFNLRADRDFNLEAGRNFNIASGSGNININSGNNLNAISVNDMLLRTMNDFNVTSDNDTKLSVGGSYGSSITYDSNNVLGGNYNISNIGKVNILSQGIMAIKSNVDVSISGGESITLSAAILSQNAGPATDPIPASPPDVNAPKPLDLFSVPQRSTAYPWAGNFYKAPNISSIMQRIPSHEPWDQHESSNPFDFTLAKTDASVGTTIPGNNGTPKAVFTTTPAFVAAGGGAVQTITGGTSNSTSTNSFLPSPDVPTVVNKIDPSLYDYFQGAKK